jgi:hypothetical protein
MMPATTPNPAKALPEKNGNSAPEYVKCDLTAEQKLLCKAWSDEVENVDVIAWLDKAGDNGDILSLKHIVGQEGYQANLTGGELSTNHKHKCLIARASTMWRALLVLMYKDSMVLEGHWLVTSREYELDL